MGLIVLVLCFLMTAVGPTYSRIQDYAANVHSHFSIYIIGP